MGHSNRGVLGIEGARKIAADKIKEKLVIQREEQRKRDQKYNEKEAAKEMIAAEKKAKKKASIQA